MKAEPKKPFTLVNKFFSFKSGGQLDLSGIVETFRNGLLDFSV